MQHRPVSKSGGKYDTVFLWTVIGFLLFGLLVLASASGPSGYAKFGDTAWFIKHQLLFGVLPGAFLFFFFARLPYQHLRKLALPLFVFSLVLLLLVFVPGIGAGWGTSQSWLNIFGFSFQPAELMKLSFVIYLAAWLEKMGEREKEVMKGSFAPFLLVVALVALLLVLQPDIGGMSIIVGTAFLMYFLAGASIKHLLGAMIAGLGALALLIGLAPYRAARFTTFLHPELDPRGIGYHINQALLAIGSGGLFGLGFGRSRQKFLYLPEVEGDSIFAVMAEEFGFIPLMLFFSALLFLLFRGFSLARRANDRFGQLLVGGILGWIGLQAFINIGGMLSLIPLTGLTLPFISYGGTSTVVTLAAMGVVLNVSRHARSA